MKLYLLDYGHCDVDKGVVLTPGSGVGERVAMPVVGYLIETDDGRRILVDTGMHRKHIADPEATYRGTDFANDLSPRMTAADDPVNRLAEVGLTPADIDILITTHFHFDHVGNHADFAAARIVAHRAGYSHAKTDPADFPPDVWDLPELEYELIDGDLTLASGVELVETPGHVPGHLSVVVRLPKTGLVILAADAINTEENLATDNWQRLLDPVRGRASARRLADLARRENGLLITGHDPVQWSNLKLAPAYYD